MINQFKKLPLSIQKEIVDHIRALQALVLSEAREAFDYIVKEYNGFDFYNVGLYYSEGSWSYLIPTFASEQGLTRVAEQYAKHSVTGVEEQKTGLRWSPCDSPHHGNSDMEELMCGTQDALDTFSELLGELDPDYNESMAELFGGDNDSYYKLVDEIHEMLRQAVNQALKTIANDPDFSKKYDSSKCVITLNAGDMDINKFLDNVLVINGENAFKRVSEEVKAAHEQHEVEYQLMQKKLKHEKDNPPTTTLVLADFKPEIDHFSPSFKTADGGIYLAKEFDYPVGNSSYDESMFNRIEFMPLLKSSEHYDEIDKLYGHFLGNNFGKNDLFPSICREFAKKLSVALTDAYPNDAFRIYLIVDRNTLYHMTFCKHRDDDFEFTRYLINQELGVEEVYLVSKEHNELASR